MRESPLVSILCTTYNHAPYVRKTLDGFFRQKTNFSYEVIVHDDASTDGTDKVIREYEKKFSNQMIAIYQIENQTSKKIDIWREYLIPRIQGKYVALCEGDDYWTSSDKLQKQISYMEEFPDCSMTFHAVNVMVDGGIVCNDRHAASERDYSAAEIIKNDGAFCATASLCCRTSFFCEYPEFRAKAIVGDYPLQVLMALSGRVHYFPDVMAVYRFMRPGSWGEKQSEDLEYKKRWILESIKLMQRIDDFTQGKFQDITARSIENYRKQISDFWQQGELSFKGVSDLIHNSTK